MKLSIQRTVVLLSVLALCIGCTPQQSDKPATQTTHSEHEGHDHAHQSKYNEVLVEFPGHKYSMEIIDERETTGLVTAFLTDAHFEPVEVDAKEVKLNFILKGSPKTFTLVRAEQEAGKPATFTLTDMELATLNCEGWEGEATASVVIGGTPYKSKLVKLGHHDHGDHGDGHGHAH